MCLRIRREGEIRARERQINKYHVLRGGGARAARSTDRRIKSVFFAPRLQIQMCSIAMPGELMLGHSPPAYSHHLLYGHHHHHHRSLVVNSPQPVVGQRATNSTRSVPPRIRPCLSSGSIETRSDAARNSEAAVTAAIARRKKRVVFADDRGRPLTQVRRTLLYRLFDRSRLSD